MFITRAGPIPYLALSTLVALALPSPARGAETVEKPLMFSDFSRSEGVPFRPRVEWQWSSSSVGREDVMMTPVVGDVDGDGMPEVVFVGYRGRGPSDGALTIVSGDSGREEGAWKAIDGHPIASWAGVALGDLDGDGIAEIVTVTADDRIVAVHADGSTVWVSDRHPGEAHPSGAPVIADLDADGTAEVVVGRLILGHDGRKEALGSEGSAQGVSVCVDLDGDGLQEVVVGNAAYRADGSLLWSNGLPDGMPAVADFDGDGFGEVASVSAGSLYLMDTDGTKLWGPKKIPGGRGGPPTVADFDGDGKPEVASAGRKGYVVFDTDGSQLWKRRTIDASSGVTGSSVYDFEGDGAWEVVYADEEDFYVYQGVDGEVLMRQREHASWTLFEYPVIADVDGDGEAEIVLASNDTVKRGWHGITVLGNEGGNWAPTTPVWNQHAYHITNVDDGLGIPSRPQMNWHLGHNSFRAGGLRQPPGEAFELAVTLPTECVGGRPCEVVAHPTLPAGEESQARLEALLADPETRLWIDDGESRTPMERRADGSFAGAFETEPGEQRSVGVVIELPDGRTFRTDPHTVEVPDPPELVLPDEIVFAPVRAGTPTLSPDHCTAVDLSRSRNVEGRAFRVEVVAGGGCEAEPRHRVVDPDGDRAVSLPLQGFELPPSLELCLQVPACAGEEAPEGTVLRITPAIPEYADLAAEAPLRWTVERRNWLVCNLWWILLICGALFLLWLIYGFIRPARFPRDATIQVAGSERGLRRAAEEPLVEQRGSSPGFYRDARLGIHGDGSVNGRVRGAMVKIRIRRDNVLRVEGGSLEVLDRRKRRWVTPDDVGTGHELLPGTTCRAGDVYFKLQF